MINDKMSLIFKSVAKSLIPNKYWYFIRWNINNFGTFAAVVEYFRILVMTRIVKEIVVKVKVPNTNIKLQVRPIYTDLIIFDDIFIKELCNATYKSAKFIVDAGAHIGLVSIYFALKYPKAMILAIEPEDGNYELLAYNTKKFPRIKILKAGLWSHKTKLSILNPEEPSWGFQVGENNGKIDAISVEDAMEKLGTSFIDILKMNIEGSEKELFLSSGSWIDRVRIIIVELHDRFRPGCTQAMENAIKGRNFVITRLGYNTILSQQNNLLP